MDTSTTGENENIRSPLSQQSAQCIIVDLSSPITDADLSIISESLLRVLPAVCVLPGPPRVPILGLIVCNNDTGIAEEVVLNFEKVRGNFTRCYEAVRHLHTEFCCNTNLAALNNTGSNSITTSVTKAINLYENSLKAPNSDYDLELSIISTRYGYQIRRYALKAVTLSEISRLKVLNILTIQRSSYKPNLDEFMLSDDDEQGRINSEQGIEGEALINIQYNLISTDISEEACDELSNHFLRWITDKNTDNYHLLLNVPHPYNEGEMMSLYFDTKEITLPSTALPLSSKSTLELSEMYIKPPHMLCKADSLIKYSTEIQKLRIIYQIYDTRVILPYLYGSPMILQATQCWKVDWDELETNLTHISALHHHLNHKKLSLICQVAGDNDSEELRPLPYYCIYPTNHSLLIQLVAYKDVLLYDKPLDVKPEGNTNFQANMDMEMSLNKVVCAENFEPQKLNTSQVMRCVTKSLLPKRVTSKRKPVTSSSSTPKLKTKYLPVCGVQRNTTVTSQGKSRSVRSPRAMDNGVYHHQITLSQSDRKQKKDSIKPSASAVSFTNMSDYGDRGAHDKTLNPLKLVPPKRRSAPASLPPPPPRQEIQSYAPTTLTNQIRIQKYTTDGTDVGLTENTSRLKWITRDTAAPVNDHLTSSSQTYDSTTAAPAAKRKRWSLPESYMETSPQINTSSSGRHIDSTQQDERHSDYLHEENSDPSVADLSSELLSPMDIATFSQTQPRTLMKSPLAPSQTKQVSMSETKAKYKYIKPSLRSPGAGGRFPGVTRPPSYTKPAENIARVLNYASTEFVMNNDGVLSPAGSDFNADDILD